MSGFSRKRLQILGLPRARILAFAWAVRAPPLPLVPGDAALHGLDVAAQLQRGAPLPESGRLISWNAWRPQAALISWDPDPHGTLPLRSPLETLEMAQEV